MKSRQESTSGQKKPSRKEVTSYECKEPGHYKNECPKLKRDKKPKKDYKAKKKWLMVTFDDSESEEEDFDEESEVEALMATTSDKEADPEVVQSLAANSDFEDENKVFAYFSHYELETALSEIMEKHDFLLSKHKSLKKDFLTISEVCAKL
jgi:hypothetical protein